MPKKKKSPTVSGDAPVAAKRGKTAEAEQKPYPEPDPEWEQLEERYSQIGSEMRSLAKMLGVSGDGAGEEQP